MSADTPTHLMLPGSRDPNERITSVEVWWGDDYYTDHYDQSAPGNETVILTSEYGKEGPARLALLSLSRVVPRTAVAAKAVRERIDQGATRPLLDISEDEIQRVVVRCMDGVIYTFKEASPA